MFIESITLTNFRCFGPLTTTINFQNDITAFIGDNGSGKTAAMLALQRLFGVTQEQRRVKLQDFYVGPSGDVSVRAKSFSIEVMLTFPELESDEGGPAIPDFFNHMTAEVSGKFKCRLIFNSTWTDDGSLEGAIESKFCAVKRFGTYQDTDCIELKSTDRSRIQLIYVPASRDGASQVSAFLRSRLWRAINWSPAVKKTFAESSGILNQAFYDESAVMAVGECVTARWHELHTAGTDATPIFRPLDNRFEEFVRRVEVVFHPDESGNTRSIEELSDGQRSLFHLALTAGTIDVESSLADAQEQEGFLSDSIAIPSLTIIAVEEPENNLSPFYLAKIIAQMSALTKGNRAQAILSSHSASILSRIEPEQVRHFYYQPHARHAIVSPLALPGGVEETKFVREAVKRYPELYFARYVILGEGASEEVVLPKLAEAMGFEIDRSSVAIVPLGGRHVNHLWRLLMSLQISHATLLDLDLGRHDGGWGRIRDVCVQLIANGVPPNKIFPDATPENVHQHIAGFDTQKATNAEHLQSWITFLQTHGVFFCVPIDLDYAMLTAFPTFYQKLEGTQKGPGSLGDAKKAVLGENGDGSLYDTKHDDNFRWYRYLFLGRSKPSTHVVALNNVPAAALLAGTPAPVKALLSRVMDVVSKPDEPLA